MQASKQSNGHPLQQSTTILLIIMPPIITPDLLTQFKHEVKGVDNKEIKFINNIILKQTI